MAELDITLRAVPDIASAKAAAEQMANAANVGSLGTPFNARARAARGGLPPIADPPEIRRARQEMKRMQSDMQKIFAGISFLSAPVSNPTSLWGNLLTGVAVNRALSTGRGKSMLGAVGLGGTGGALAATVGIVGVAAAVGVALKGLGKVITEVTNAMDRASKLFVFKGLSGFGSDLASKRFTGAQVLGVSTEEVVKFGRAMNQLNPQLKQANENFVRTYRALTFTNWQFRVLGANVQSLFATIANSAAPALNAFANGISRIVNIIDRFAQANPNFAKLLAAAALSPIAMGAVPFMGGVGGAAATGPEGAMPKKGSAWESMGLVIGGGDRQQQAFQLWRSQLKALEDIRRLLFPNKGNRAAQPLNPHYLQQQSSQNLPST